MNEGPTVSLPARQLLVIPDPSTTTILCTSGCVWLTLDDDPRDVILEPGDRFDAAGPRRAILYALEPSAFVLAPRVPAAAGSPPPSGQMRSCPTTLVPVR